MNYYIEASCQIPGLKNIYEKVFGDKKDGTFVEVGAYDGRTYSNTYGLAVAGWHGLYIEPVPEYYDRCVGNHKSSKNIDIVRALISNGDREMLMYISPERIATLDADYKAMLWGGSDSYAIAMQSITLDSVLIGYEIPYLFDLLVIDVEGHALQVLEGFSIHVYRPKMIIIEAHETSLNPILHRDSEKISEFIRLYDYEKYWFDEINTIFVRQV